MKFSATTITALFVVVATSCFYDATSTLTTTTTTTTTTLTKSCTGPANTGGAICADNGFFQLVPRYSSCIAVYPDTDVCSHNGFLKVGSNSCIEPDFGWVNCNDNVKGLSVGDNSCNVYGACARNNGTAFIGNNACIADNINACGENVDNFIVGDGSCHGNRACWRNEAPFVVDIDSCLSHFEFVQDDTLYNPAIDTEPCSFNFESFTIGKHSCKGNGVCLFNSKSFSIGDESCISYTNGVEELSGLACGNNKGGLRVGYKSCNGDRACYSNRGEQVLTVLDQSCNAFSACRRNNGTAFTTIFGNSCNSDSSCSYNQLGKTTLTIGTKSCNAANACSNNTAGFVVGSNSCNGVGACRFINKSIVIGLNACNGPGACSSCTKNVPSGSLSCPP